MPSRREVIGVVTGSLVAFSGCTALGSTAKEPHEGYRTATVVNYVGSVEEPPLEFTSVIRSPSIDAYSPAYLEIYMEYKGDRQIWIDPPIPHYHGYPVNSDGITLWLRRAPSSPGEMAALSCLEDYIQEIEGSNFGRTHEGQNRRIKPGETQIWNYIIATDWDADGCFPPGTYRFLDEERRFRESKRDNGGSDGTYSWEIEIEIT